MAKIIFIVLLALSANAKYPQWLQDSVKVVAEFEQPNRYIPSYVEGYGFVINYNLVLTSAKIVFNKKKADEITLYHTEVLGQPIACLSHAKILALDDNLDLAVLEVERFTDIYCNILPTPNFRELSFQKTYFNLFKKPIQTSLQTLLGENLKISYFSEQDWSEFLRSRIAFRDFLDFSKEEKEKMLGMPLFIENDFLGLKVKEFPNASSESLKVGILTHKEILDFLCKLENETLVFKNKKDLKEFCKQP
ncbi:MULTISPECIES: hypothetical protein [Helicobacter]|uniref:Periplasmic protein n=9 Tax=Helicobacteraceae TaxID=72293 RepID=A0A3D8IEJ9_9HELI|nr:MULTISPECIES: hypothetical protein [Helicobacter]RDU62971.1 hypothetical protein CQA43_04915 [Helicobacter ganmani]